MIVTLTPNPSVDRTIFLSDIVLGSVNRSQRSRSEAGGGRERQRDRSMTDGGNAVLRSEGRADQPPRAALTAEPRAE